MADEETIHPEVIRTYTSKTLEQQRDTSVAIRAALTPDPYKSTVTAEGNNLYSAGVRAAYLALCQIELQGRSGKIDAREIEALKQGLEDFLIRK